MKTKPIILAAVAAVLALAACHRDHAGFEKAESGLWYKFYSHHEETGKVVTGDEVTVSLRMYTPDTVFLSTGRDSLLSDRVMVEESIYPGDLFDALRMMSDGDSATFILNGNDLFYKFFRMESLPAYLKDSSEVFVDLKIRERTPKAEADRRMQEMNAAREQMLEEMRQSEPERIAEYIKEHRYVASKKPSGLYYIEIVPGKGPRAAEGRSVTVNYTAKLPDGKIIETSRREEALKSGIFDSLFEYTPFSFVMGDKATVAGWEEGISYMKQGGKSVLVVPSSLAYGADGLEDIIPPYSPVIYEIEVLEVK